jgi:ankyrin repeat protein
MPNLLDYCVAGDLESLKKHLKPDSIIEDSEKATLLVFACDYGHLGIVKYLVEDIGVDVNALDDYGHVPLIEAARVGGLNIVKYLLDQRADINIVNAQKKTVLMSSVHHPEVFSYLFPLVANFEQCDYAGRNLLYYLERAVGKDSDIYEEVRGAIEDEDLVIVGESSSYK